MTPPLIISELSERYRENLADYRAPGYKEFRLRKEFIDPFFEALGWDIANRHGYAEAYKDVIHEDSLRVGGNLKAPDYAFRIGQNRKFFVETKSPSVPVERDAGAAYQLRRYGWNAKLPLSVLTNFESFSVYDCRIRLNQTDRASSARILHLGYADYLPRWGEIEAIFGRAAILKGGFDRYVQDATRKRGTAEVDKELLSDIEKWRESLARSIATKNHSVNVRELNFAVQQTIDRILFLRIAEDRGFEPYGTLQSILKGNDVYGRLIALFRQADERYNSGLFHFREADGSSETLDTFTLSLRIDDKTLRGVISSLYYPISPYEFSVLPADILGQVYEQFLGKVIQLVGHTAQVSDKPDVKKSGGVFYTPTYIVRRIVESTLGSLLRGRTLAHVSGQDKRGKGSSPIRVLDPACGSGSFLIEAYQYLLDWYRDRYIEEGPQKHAKGRHPRLYEGDRGAWRLDYLGETANPARSCIWRRH